MQGISEWMYSTYIRAKPGPQTRLGMLRRRNEVVLPGRTCVACVLSCSASLRTLPYALHMHACTTLFLLPLRRRKCAVQHVQTFHSTATAIHTSIKRRDAVTEVDDRYAGYACRQRGTHALTQPLLWHPHYPAERAYETAGGFYLVKPARRNRQACLQYVG